ncbi:hypothetical protein BKA69DRAFT_1168841 [Paraphysoderma sedebokerense]|nr:hypothetical protein BKA69DRAFT_1168841 [Paraphysoderma sedebokerense]
MGYKYRAFVVPSTSLTPLLYTFQINLILHSQTNQSFKIMRLNITFLLVAVLAVGVLGSPQPQRPEEGYGRGVGTTPDQCGENEERKTKKEPVPYATLNANPDFTVVVLVMHQTLAQQERNSMQDYVTILANLVTKVLVPCAITSAPDKLNPCSSGCKIRFGV